MKKRMVRLLFAFCIVCLLTGSFSALASAPQLSCVTDTAGLLEQTQVQRLEQMAQAVTEEYDVGVYIVSVEDYRQIDTAGVYEATYGVYHAYTMGQGEARNGIMLLLSQSERDYALFCYGEKAEYAFNAYGQEKLEGVFLDNFADDDWYGGFEDYICECAAYLEKAEAGKPVSKSPIKLILIFSGVSLLLAGLVCVILLGQMKTVHKKTTADVYAADGLNLTVRYDQFTHRTESRRKIERNTASGSSSHSGGGGSGRSGKF